MKEAATNTQTNRTERKEQNRERWCEVEEEEEEDENRIILRVCVRREVEKAGGRQDGR